MNVADSDKLAAILNAAGYLPTLDIGLGTLDLLLVNTCVVRQNAEDRAAWFVTSAKGLKEKNPNLKIVLCGCLVTEPGRDVKKMFPHVDLFLPPNSPEMLAEYLLNSKLETLNSKQIKNSNLEIVSDLGFRNSSFVTITHGCDNFCSYCVVPYVRGREVSRPMAEVLEEIRGLGERGIREITLLGQNVNSYKYGLAQLLYQISRSPDNLILRYPDLRISFTTSHPKDMSNDIIMAVKELPYVFKDFHLPLQSGDDDVLAKMNRGYTTGHFRELVARIRSDIPAARVSSEVIVGFPGETEEQFQHTLDFVKEMKFTHVNMFAYSFRPGTAAEKFSDQVAHKIKERRLSELIALVRTMNKNPA